MNVKFLGNDEFPYIKKNSEYKVISIEDGLYRIFCELCDDDYLFHPSRFEIIEDEDREKITLSHEQFVENSRAFFEHFHDNGQTVTESFKVIL